MGNASVTLTRSDGSSLLNVGEAVFRFKTQNGVFVPTETSNLLVTGFSKFVKKQGTLLDLGSGCGIVGITLAKLKLAAMPVYASDISSNAVKLTLENAAEHECEVVAKTGSLLEPWKGYKFDYIVDDISGISEEIAGISSWFREGVSCCSGRDGTKLVGLVIQNAPKYLEPEGLFFFPVLSLSDSQKLISIAKQSFSNVKQLLRKEWPIPSDMIAHADQLRQLSKEGCIQIEEKFGLMIWFTEIYVAWN